MLTTLASLLVMIVGFGVLIFVHELGHFLAAKWAGIRAEAFAVGMGPPVFSWRKGVGLRVGSTDRTLLGRYGKTGGELTDAELERHGIGETEYSLRALPLGGFVKMLGQEDGKPVEDSDDPRSYAQCPVWKRMIVVSAGVIMNVILAFVLFAVAFQVGVNSEAPIIGTVRPDSPAARAVAENAGFLGVDDAGLLPGDRVVFTDDSAVRTFSDLTIAGAMSKPGEPVALAVERAGLSEPLRFSIIPEHDPISGLLAFGIAPARSTTLLDADVPALEDELRRSGLWDAGVRAGMTMRTAAGKEVSTYEELDRVADARGGGVIETAWVDPAAPDASVEAPLEVVPRFEVLEDASTGSIEMGLLGFVPLVEVLSTDDGPNSALLRAGDVMLRTGELAAPRLEQMIEEIGRHAGRALELVLLRDGEPVTVTVEVSREGRVGFVPGYAWSTARMAEPIRSVAGDGDEAEARATAAAGAGLLPGATMLSIGGRPTSDWADMRAAMRAATAEAVLAGTGATVELAYAAPIASDGATTAALELGADDVARLHELGWRVDVNASIFDSCQTVLSAGGSPLRAITMGLQETHKVITMTYLTIDRLFRGSVGVDQLRGPVGIIDLGAKILPRGFMYFLFFQGLISVNLAVINFLPLPIVDGGLFLFLIYERFKGRPPSIRFQNAATMVGLVLIGTVFIVTFYNDIMRLIG